ncbi:MAG: ATP-binding protein [Lachnospiraceae bacterium]|nr:ATP-binding protein [Lachnospiraceae bacterium]
MIGRKYEISELRELYDSDKAELVAIYGRRRVGKTYLVDQVFKGQFSFKHAGLAPAEEKGNSNGLMREQLDEFYHSLLLHGMKRSHIPKNWIEAFFMLEKLLEQKDDGSRQVVFLDELPWLDTPRSGFLRAFEGFWNIWGCHRDNLMVIICGSANSWILDNLINNHGGLYNRVTYELKLSPFTLAECEEFYESKSLHMSRYDIVQSYMIIGGIPYYMGYFRKGLGLAQNIDRLFYTESAKLRDEFRRLFSSAFDKPELVQKIVRFLNTRNYGYTRQEIAEALGISTGGWLTKGLNALVASDFVVKYVPFGESKRYEYYRLTDPFCIFYLKFVDGNHGLDEQYWQKNYNSHSVVSWRGIAFERVCFNHIRQIKKVLEIGGVSTTYSAWIKRDDDNEEGTQIDLIITRSDNVVNMCELKYYGDDYSVKKDYYRKILRRQELLREVIPAKVSIQSTLITTFGLVKNEYNGAFSNVIVLDDLFT